jgi:hypothetical protein
MHNHATIFQGFEAWTQSSFFFEAAALADSKGHSFRELA